MNSLQIPASAVATALKDMMRKLDEPILSLEQFDECQTLTSKKRKQSISNFIFNSMMILVEQLREQKFSVLQKALRRTNELKYRTNRAIFRHLHLYVERIDRFRRISLFFFFLALHNTHQQHTWIRQI